MRPQKQMTNLPAPRSSNELRAPKTATIRGGRGVPAAGPQSTTYARLNWGKKDQGQSFSLTEDSPKTASTASDDPLDEAPAPSHRSASLREQKGKPAARAESLSQCSSKEHNFLFRKNMPLFQQGKREADFVRLRRKLRQPHNSSEYIGTCGLSNDLKRALI